MESLKIKYLGTSAAEALPGLFCNCLCCRQAMEKGGKNIRMRSSALVNDCILIDLSPDFAYAKANFKIDTSLINTVLVTHTHQDHFNLNMLSYNCGSFSDSPQPLKIYLSSYANRLLKKAVFEKKNDVMELITPIEAEPFTAYTEGGYTIVPLEAAHNAPHSLIFLITYNGITLLYGNDTGMLTKKTLKYLQNVKMDIVSLDGTMGKSKGQYNRHMGFDEVKNLKDYFIASGNCDNKSEFIVTHFSHFIGMQHQEIEQYLKPYGIKPAYDGMEVAVTK